jgi:polyferredoxin
MFEKNKFLKRHWYNYALMIFLILFYIFLFLPDYIKSIPDIFAHAADALGLPTKWIFYGLLYTVAVILGGIRVLKLHGFEGYQRIRTFSVMGVQLFLAFIAPYIMLVAMKADYYFSYFWPLKIEYFYPGNIMKFGLVIVFYSFIGSAILFPILAYFYGKRFYCSWVCGCGGLANTAGDHFRHYSDKRLRAWKFERIAIYSMLGLAIVVTILAFINHFSGGQNFTVKRIASFGVKWYAIIVSFGLAGLVGVAAYPIFGTRVWCRFFCPMAAGLGVIQKMGRFRITAQKDLCISCGNCSKYCEMGIDVRYYAQKNIDVRRAGCVGCGYCAHVCPRGVLKLENKKKYDA